MAVPLMFLVDWSVHDGLSSIPQVSHSFSRFNRSAFEEKALDILRRRDLVDIPSYYSRSPSSGFWVLQYGKSVVAFIAVDASLDSTSDKAIPAASPPASGVSSPAPDTSNIMDFTKGTSAVARIRHLYVEEPYRASAIALQEDLLTHALRNAFSEKNIQTVVAEESPLLPYIGQALHRKRFKLQQRAGTVGIMKWQLSKRVLDRKDWQREE